MKEHSSLEENSELHPEHVEEYKDERELSPTAHKEQTLEAAFERLAATKSPNPEDEKTIKTLKHEIAASKKMREREIAASKKMHAVIANKPLGDERWEDTRPIHEKIPWYRKVAVMFGLAGATLLGAKESKATAAEDTLSKRDTYTNTTRKVPQDSMQTKKLNVYTTSKTKEGGTTPTGLSNSFFENEDDLSPEDLLAIAKQFGFRTGSALEFQTDLIEYTAEHHPEIIKRVNKKFGRTTLGKKLEKEDKLSSNEIDVKGLEDNELGARTKKIAREVIKVTAEKSESFPEKAEAAPQPKGRYVLNVRGDEPGQLGGYYFFENEKDFMEATDRIGGYSSREVYGDGSGQASINMNDETYKKFHAKENTERLGQQWQRDPENEKRFVLVQPSKKTAQYSEGLVKTK